jgi:hypothetical protein
LASLHATISVDGVTDLGKQVRPPKNVGTLDYGGHDGDAERLASYYSYTGLQ